MKTKRIDLDISEVYFDDENPRIKGALEKYGDKINAERISFALQNSFDDGAKNSSGFHALKISIKANNGIAEPIKVVKKNDRYICIDGNTRLAIYRDFAQKNKTEQWQNIPCALLEDASQIDIEKIRITTHLVGARPWPAYEKAKYIYKLRYENLMDYDDIIALCGGSRNKIETQIDAFETMNEYYRDQVDESEFKIDRFSGFVELQKQGIKEAVLQSGFSLSDFGDWIHSGKIYALADVRQLPKILRDEEARKKFIDGGVDSIKAAVRIVDGKNRPSVDASTNLEEISLHDLAYNLLKRLDIDTMTVRELRQLTGETLSNLETLSERLMEILDDARK